MNSIQYDIVKRFLAMGNSPQKIAKAFKADVADVMQVSSTATYEQYREAKAKDMFNDLFGGKLWQTP